MYGYRYYRFSLSISRDELLSVYSGQIRRIRVRTDEGLVIDLDAEHIKQFTGPDGVYGSFNLVTTQDHSFVKLERID